MDEDRDILIEKVTYDLFQASTCYFVQVRARYWQLVEQALILQGTKLEHLLSEAGCDTVIVAGVMTNL